MEATHVSTDGWMNKWNVVYIYICVRVCVYNEILFSYEKEGNLAICSSRMNLKGTMLSKINQRKTNTLQSHYVEYKNNWGHRFSE